MRNRKILNTEFAEVRHRALRGRSVSSLRSLCLTSAFLCGFKKWCLMVVLALISLFLHAQQEPPIRVFDSYQGQNGSWIKYRDLDLAWYNHVFESVRNLSEGNARQPLNAMRNLQNWEQKQLEIQKNLLNSIDGLPEKAPLNPQITGKLKRKTFTVEKLIYESLPGFYVTAALFMPQKRQNPAPAIIYCSGHTREGFRSPTYQHIILNLVEKGFIVLAFDPIGQGERYQYLDEKGQPELRATHDHSYSGVQGLLVNKPLARYMINDGVRAVDYLISRPEVDSTRIGITGRSGGGTQTAYIAAYDERIAASAPENFITTAKRLWESIGPQDAEQNLPLSLNRNLDHKELLAVRAPKPTLVITTTRDYFSIQGAKEAYEEVGKLYSHLGQEQNIQFAQDDHQHGSTQANRETMYAFFQHHLNNPGSAEDLDVEVFSEEELKVTQTGQVVSAVQSKTVFDMNKALFKSPTKPFWEREMEALGDEEGTDDRFYNMLDINLRDEVFTNVFTGQIKRNGYTVQKYFLEHEPYTSAYLKRYPIPYLLVQNPAQSSSSFVLYLDERDKSRQLKAGGEIEKLVKAGHTVIAMDVLNTGELASSFGGDSKIEDVSLNLVVGAHTVGRDLVTFQVQDIYYLVEYLRNHVLGENGRLSVMANGTLCVPLLHYTAIQAFNFQEISLINPLVSWADLLNTRHYQPHFAYTLVPGALFRYDLPDLMAVKSGQELHVINPLHADGKKLTVEEAQMAYEKAKEVYGADKFSISVE